VRATKRTIVTMNGALLDRYPLNGWQPAQRFCATTWPHAGPTDGFYFQAAEMPGTWVVPGAEADWNFNLQLDAVNPAPRIWTITNGVAITPAAQSDLLAYQLLVRPQAWAGFAALPCIPSLFAAQAEVKRVGEDRQEVSAGGWHVVLLRTATANGIRFAWAVSREDLATAQAEAEAALDIDVAARAETEWHRRSTVLDKQRVQSDEDRRHQAAALEALIAGLRAPQGVFANIWSASATEPGCFNLNEVLPLVAAWFAIDRQIAAQLVGAALDAQVEDSFLPAWIKPDGTASAQMMWPALASSWRRWIRTAAASQLLDRTVAATARGLVAMLDRFEEKGSFSWVRADEAFVPDLFDDDLLTVDLTALLLMECEACLQAAEEGWPIDPLDFQAIRSARTTLTEQLEYTLWNSKTSRFTDRYREGAFIRRQTLGRFLALGTASLSPAVYDTAWEVLRAEQTKQTAGLPTLWEYWESDPLEPPVSLLHLAYVQHAVQAYRAPAEYLPVMDRWYASLTAGETTPLTDPVAAAFALTLKQPVTRANTKRKYAKWILWMDRHRALVWTLIAVPVLTVLLGVSLYLLFRSDPTGADMEAMHGIAERHYQDGHYEKAVAIYQELHRFAPRNLAINHQLGNALHRAERYAEAEEHYRLAVEAAGEWPMPRTLRNLAITLYKQERYEEAVLTFQQLLDLYAEDYYPEMIEQARTALQIIQEYH